MGALIGDGREWRRELIGAVLVGVFFGLVGPFGTYFNDTVGMRIAFWVGMMVAGFLIYGPLLRLALGLGARFGQPIWFTAPLAVLVIAAPVGLMSAVVVVRLWPTVGPHMRPIDWYGQAVVLGLPLCALALWSRRAFPSQPRSAPLSTGSPPAGLSPPTPAARSFLDRLPPRLGRTLLCLQMEDHYVRVHRLSGSRLELMPLHEAIARYGQAGGVQVHRSWWVAASAIDGAERDLRNWRLRLNNGLVVPVARNRIAEVRARGWIGEDV